MSLDVTFHCLAELELNEAAQYYDRESPGLGASFLDEAERTVAAIVEHPEVGALARGSVRRRLLHRFAYGTLYAHTSAEIRILAVMNADLLFWRISPSLQARSFSSSALQEATSVGAESCSLPRLDTQAATSSGLPMAMWSSSATTVWTP